jgi:hypothetical protein
MDEVAGGASGLILVFWIVGLLDSWFFAVVIVSCSDQKHFIFNFSFY